MKKSEELKIEIENLTDTFAIKNMKKRIALALVKERAEKETTDKGVSRLIEALTFDIDKHSRELMAIDHDEEKKRVVKLHEMQSDLIDLRKRLNDALVKFKNNTSMSDEC